MSSSTSQKKGKQNWSVRKMLLELAFTVRTVFNRGISNTVFRPQTAVSGDVKGKRDKEWAILLCQQSPFITTRN